MSRIVLVDAYAQIYRCFYAVRGLTNASGEPVNALFGIARLLIQLHRGLPSEYGAVVFDKGKAVRRIAQCPEYKAQRPPMPDEMRSQIGPIRDWIRAFGWNIVEQEGLEADDLIAAIARRHGEAEVAIVTHDKDIAQLTVDSQVTLANPEKGDAWSSFGPAEVREKFGVGPELLGDFLALVGDAADNIAGVQGIGPKTAASLLNDYGKLDEILAEPGRVKNARLSVKLAENRALLERNRFLVALADDLPEGWQGLADIARREPEWDTVLAMAEAQGFKSLLATLKKLRGESAQPMLF